MRRKQRKGGEDIKRQSVNYYSSLYSIFPLCTRKNGTKRARSSEGGIMKETKRWRGLGEKAGGGKWRRRDENRMMQRKMACMEGGRDRWQIEGPKGQ